ncbi:uncharacterized protein TrAtP1_004839 [Trichoderma atroviride]|uniref:uncharacterized protein n=1 Tax=Hypocrea atroviridis TaxID=63577 RepID=UPI00332A7116|nr:hypothetical protein TrAtP1_004839 [Trichoderma atroviride]
MPAHLSGGILDAGADKPRFQDLASGQREARDALARSTMLRFTMQSAALGRLIRAADSMYNTQHIQ